MHASHLAVLRTAAPVALAAFLASAARADDLADLRRDQEELRRLVESQQKEIDRLRASSARGGDAGADLGAMIDELAKRADGPGLVTWKQLTRQGSKFTLYGFVRLDVQHDGSRMNSTQLPVWVRSEDPTAPASIGAPRNEPDMNMHTKLTRLGLDFDGPVVDGLGGAKITGKLETDFYNATTTSSRPALRIRHAWVKMAWCDSEYSVLAGQSQELISPLNPAVNNDMVMWGAGNLGDRRPQIRAEWAPSLNDGAKLFVQGMMGDTGAIDGKDLDAAGTTGAGFLDGQMSGRPTWQGRVALRVKNWDEKDAELGLWMHTASEQQDADVGSQAQRKSRAVGLDIKLPLLSDQIWIQGEFWRGQNLADVRGGILQSVNTTTGESIHSRGGFAELGWKAAPWLTTYAGYSYDDPENSDLEAGGVTGGRARNRVVYLAARISVDPMDFGLEWLHWKTEFIGFKDGTNDRIVAFVAYKF